MMKSRKLWICFWLLEAMQVQSRSDTESDSSGSDDDSGESDDDEKEIKAGEEED